MLYNIFTHLVDNMKDTNWLKQNQKNVWLINK